jgi:hypothetical protein
MISRFLRGFIILICLIGLMACGDGETDAEHENDENGATGTVDPDLEGALDHLTEPVSGTIGGYDFEFVAGTLEILPDGSFHTLTVRNFEIDCEQIGDLPDPELFVTSFIQEEAPGVRKIEEDSGHGANFLVRYGGTSYQVTDGLIRLDDWTDTDGEYITGALSMNAEEGEHYVEGTFEVEVCNPN